MKTADMIESIQGQIDLPYFQKKYPQFTQQELLIIIESLNGILWSRQIPLRTQFVINLQDFNSNQGMIEKFEIISDDRLLLLIAEIYAFWVSDDHQMMMNCLESISDSYNR